MRTNIDIDDKLMEKALKASGAQTKKAVVDEALRLFVRTKSQGGIRELFGTVQWEGDLEQSRSNRLPDDAWTR
jgi:Arc/MetJ family transcription regulator